jgi:hypothetical protein
MLSRTRSSIESTKEYPMLAIDSIGSNTKKLVLVASFFVFVVLIEPDPDPSQFT